MADTHGDGHGGHGNGHGDLFGVYMTVAIILGVCTAASFAFNYLAHPDVKTLTVFTAFLLILLVAILKASLVGWYFMHLKWDWKLLYFLIIPAFIMGAMMMVVLMPDIFLGPIHDGNETLQIARELAPAPK
jgi:cytochrome c oxidase subunit 4